MHWVSDLARVCMSILYVLMKPMSSNILRTHCRHTKTAEITTFPFCVSFSVMTCCPGSFIHSFPHRGCGVIRQGARCVCELCVAGVDLYHWFNPRHQKLSHLFFWNLQHTHTESYWVNHIDSVRKFKVCATGNKARKGHITIMWYFIISLARVDLNWASWTFL